MGLLDQMEALGSVIDEYHGDVVSSGLQIPIMPGVETITPLDGDQTYIVGGTKLGLVRLRLQDQGGMMVANVGLSTQHEVIGIIDADGNRIPHPAYTKKQFAGWGNWVHLMSTQFMNIVNFEDFERLMKLIGEDGYGNYKIFDRQREPEEGAEPRESKVDVLFDWEPRGNGVQERHANAIPLAKATIVVEDPVFEEDGTRLPLIGDYMDGDEYKRRPGFTGFIDVLNHNGAGLMAALALPQDHENRSDIIKQARSQMSMLTGNDERDPENRYPLRPTIANLTIQTPPQMPDESDDAYAERLDGLPELVKGFEVDLFKGSRGERDAAGTTGTTGQLTEAYGGDSPFTPQQAG